MHAQRLLKCLVAYLLLSYYSYGQQGMPHYYAYLRLTQQADSAAHAGHHTQAAQFYAQAARVKDSRGTPVAQVEPLYQAAYHWALGGIPDSAFRKLDALTSLGFTAVDSLRSDAAFTRLHPDPRWPRVLGRVARNAAQASRFHAAYTQRTTFAGAADEVVFYPPKRYLQQLIYNDTLPLVSFNYGHFRLFFRGNSYTAAHLPAVQQQLTAATARILGVLQQSTYQRGIYLLLADSKQELRELTGMSPGGGFALAGYDAAFLVNNPSRRLQAKHELFHLIANEVWGLTSSRLLNEGAAVYCDNECYYENPYDGISAYLLRSGKALPVQALISDFDAIAQTNEVGAYLQSASLFKYLYERYGVAKMRQLWTAGFNHFEAIYGFSVKQFERDWKAFIRKIAVPPHLDWHKLQQEGCG